MADAISIVIKGEAGGAIKALKDTEQGTRDAAKAAQEGGGHFAGLGDHVEGLKSHLGSLTTVLAGVAGSFTAAFEIKSALGRASEITGEVAKLKREMGGTAEEASKLRFQFEETGVSFETGEKGIRKFEKALAGISDMEDGVAIPAGKAMVANLKALGIEAEDASGKQRPLNDVIGDLAEKFHNMPDGVEKTALATSLFGRAGADLLPFLNRGKEGLADLGKEAGKLGLVLDQNMLDTMKKNKEATREFHAALDGIQLQIGVALMPIVTSISIKLTEFAIAFNQHAIPAIKEAAKWIQAELVPALKAFIQNDALPMLRAFAQVIVADVLPALKEFAGFIVDKLSEPLQKFSDLLGGHDTLLKALAITIAGVLVAAFVLWAGSAAAAAVATIAATAPVLAIGAAIALLIGGIILLVRNWDDLTARYPLINAATAKAREAFQGLTKWFNDELSPAVLRFVDVYGPLIQHFWENQVQPTLKALLAAFQGVVAWVQEHWPEIQAVIEPVLNQVMLAIQTVAIVLSNTIALITNLINGDWSAAWENAKAIVGGLLDYVTGTFANLKRFLVAQVGIIKDLAGYVGNAIVNGIRDGIGALWDGLVEWVEAKALSLKDRLVSMIDPRNWDIPGLSPLLPAMHHAGQLAGGRFTAGMTLGMDALPGAMSQAMSRGIAGMAGALQSGGKPIAATASDYGPAVMAMQNLYLYGSQSQQDAVTAAINQMIAAGTYHGYQSYASALSSIPHAAAGGIVTRPTLALVGESGPEAIVPLARGGGASPSITINIQAWDSRDVERAMPELARQLDRHLKRVGLAGVA